MIDSLLEDLEILIRRDPAQRGLLCTEPQFGRLGAGHFAGAARSLAASSPLSVGLVTGFFVPSADPPAAETDGPPGAVRLALTLTALGHQAMLITDALCAPAIRAAAEAMEFPSDQVVVFPESPEEEDRWMERFFAEGTGRELTHLIAIERVGPSHTIESLLDQSNDRAILEEFLNQVPAESRGCCHNARGDVIDAWTGGLHKLFERGPEFRPQLTTIGIGDGGNEIGMGALRWEDVTRRLSHSKAARTPCRIATDWNVIAGTSNWGGYALAAAVVALRNRIDVIEPWTCECERQALEALVANGPAVDGITKLREATVDGLPFLTYVQAWAGIRRRLGLPE